MFPIAAVQKGSARILVYTFQNETGPAQNAHYATILTESLAGRLRESGQYVVETSESVKPAYRAESLQRSLLEREMAYTAQRDNYDVILSGSYRVRGATISVVTNIYTVDGAVITSNRAGGALTVSMNTLIDRLLEANLTYIRQYYSGSVFGPQFTPEQGLFRHFATISIASEPGAEIYYTLDGSAPTVEKGKRYTAPFDIFRSSEIRAVGYKNGSYSKMNNKNYTQLYRASPFELKVLYGYAQYFSPDQMGPLMDSPVLSAIAGWEIATNDGARKVPVLRDTGLLLRADFAGSDVEGPLYGTYQNYSGGLFYRIRLGSNFMIDMPLSAGVAVQSYIDQDSKENTSIFYKSGASSNSAYDPVFAGALLFNWELYHFGITAGPTLSYIMNSDDRIFSLYWQAGCFIRI